LQQVTSNALQMMARNFEEAVSTIEKKNTEINQIKEQLHSSQSVADGQRAEIGENDSLLYAKVTATHREAQEKGDYGARGVE
jgi:hypothetical protein